MEIKLECSDCEQELSGSVSPDSEDYQDVGYLVYPCVHCAAERRKKKNPVPHCHHCGAALGMTKRCLGDGRVYYDICGCTLIGLHFDTLLAVCAKATVPQLCDVQKNIAKVIKERAERGE